MGARLQANGPVALLDWDNSLRSGFTLSDALLLLGDSGRQAHETWLGLISDYRAARIDHQILAERAEDVYCAAMAGRSVTAYQQAVQRFVELDRLRPGVDVFLEAIMERGWEPIMVSGAPFEFLEAWRSRAIPDLSMIVAWQLAEAAGRYHGHLEAPGNTATKRVKKQAIHQILGSGEAKRTVKLGLGDSDADRPLWDSAEIRVKVDASSQDEGRRIKWSGRLHGRGGFTQLAAAIRRLD